MFASLSFQNLVMSVEVCRRNQSNLQARLLAARGDANERAEPKGQLYWDCLKAQVCVKLHGLVALVS